MAPPPRPLPTKDGVGPSCVALPAGPWLTMAEFLAHHFPAVTPETWAARMQAGEVVDEQGVPVTAQRAYQPHTRLYYYRSLDAEPRLPFDEVLLHQDEHLQETVLVRLKRRLGLDTLTPIHRLDRETAGVVLFSTQPATRGHYQALFAQRAVTKHYEAVAPWQPDLSLPLTRHTRIEEDTEHFMQMREVPGAPNAETHVEVIKVAGDLALYRLSPVTGRRHQLRVHCAALGMPIVNDLIYPKLLPMDSDDHAKPLQLLARSVVFVDPLTGVVRRFESARSLMLEA
jgi:tRNA pseudouridine32 synthase/23S rRNA pseudouridine746 synthase